MIPNADRLQADPRRQRCSPEMTDRSGREWSERYRAVNVLVAKRPSLARGGRDVWSAMRGEIVVAPFVCQDRGCGCDQVHQGIVSHGYSSEVEVRDIAASQEALIAACRSHLGFSQWGAVIAHPSELEGLAADLIEDMRAVAERYPTATVLRMTFDHHVAQWRYVVV